MMREEQEPPRIIAVVPVVDVEEVKQDVLEGQGQRRILLDQHLFEPVDSDVVEL
jgi:hypothetical protein